ncbi:MAG TPA: glycosyltransferase, partial [Dongiaceae bacterium]|nr:glycosyltransferase [Dongiaceae bacterium]
NLVTHFITEQTINLATRSVVNRWRRKELGLPPEPLAGNVQRQRRRQVPHFLGYSQHVLPRPADWGENVHVTGYWFLPMHSDWQPPPAVVEFLQSGPPPVYVGFGSLSVRSPVEFTRLMVSALEMSGRRGLLSRGWGNLGGIPLPKTILKIDSIPHEWLFPQVAAVVHHGGCGTTAAGLRSGVPTITIPFFADQFLWAERVMALGAGPASIPYASLTAEKLAQAIRTATGDPAVRAAAQGVGSRLRAENGVENMVASFERCLKRQ